MIHCTDDQRVGRVAIAGLMIAALVGCASSPAEDSAERDPDLGCTAEFPTLAELEHDSDEEADAAEDMPVCLSPDQTTALLTNGSDAVWYFVGTAPSEYTVMGTVERAESFRDILTSGGASYEFVIPDESIIIAADAEWHIDAPLTATWLAHDVLTTTAEKYSTAALSALLAGGSKSRKALTDCTLAYANIAQQEVDPSDSEELVLGLLTTAASTGSCASSWRAAEAEHVPGAFPSWADDVARAGEVADNITTVHTRWNWLQTFCIAVTRLC